MPKLKNILKKLSLIPSFINSIPHRYSQTTYMEPSDIKNKLLRRFNQINKMKSFRGCGELTKNERKELALLQKYFDDAYDI